MRALERVAGTAVAVLLCSLAGFLGMSATVAADEVAFRGNAIQPFEVTAYQENFGVSKEIAERNLGLQRRGTSIVRQLEAAEGDRYAGVWFDNEAGEFVVPALKDVPSPKIRAALDSAHLEGNYRIAAAQYSWNELLRAHEKLDARLLPGSDYISTSVDPRANAVVINRGKNAPESMRELGEIAEAAEVRVDLRAKSDREVLSQRLACGQYKFYFEEKVVRACDRPLRAGVYIEFAAPGFTNCARPASKRSESGPPTTISS